MIKTFKYFEWTTTEDQDSYRWTKVTEPVVVKINHSFNTVNIQRNEEAEFKNYVYSKVTVQSIIGQNAHFLGWKNLNKKKIKNTYFLSLLFCNVFCFFCWSSCSTFLFLADFSYNSSSPYAYSSSELFSSMEMRIKVYPNW